MLENQIITHSLKGVVFLLTKFYNEVSRLHAHSLMPLLGESNLLSRIHARFYVDALAHYDHFLSYAVVHDDQFFETNCLLATMIKFFECALNIDN